MVRGKDEPLFNSKIPRSISLERVLNNDSQRKGFEKKILNISAHLKSKHF